MKPTLMPKLVWPQSTARRALLVKSSVRLQVVVCGSVPELRNTVPACIIVGRISLVMPAAEVGL
jgi:hypothetical protein